MLLDTVFIHSDETIIPLEQNYISTEYITVCMYDEDVPTGLDEINLVGMI